MTASSRIQKLPEHIIRRIAAGEVIERPASVLKELLENALDAGAKNIQVEWEAAGRKLIRVTDDGHGMSPAEAKLALERHATSKIRSFEDLEKVMTFGFRGEALPSIAAVSRFRLTTRANGAKEGWSIECEGGRLRREGPAGAPGGTSISVEDLFFNTPAREKFLRTDGTERGFLLRTVEDVALAVRGARFQVVSDRREILHLRSGDGASPEEALRDRLKECWGTDRLAAVKPVRHSGRFLSVSGWISDVHAPQSTGRYQRFFVNGRPIVSRRLSHALYEAYRGSLLVGKHPLAVLFLEMNPSLVDVNVHPSKREVRLSHEEEVYGFLLQALRTALSWHASMPSVVAPETREIPPAETPPPAGRPSGRTAFVSRSRVALSESEAALSLQKPPTPVSPPSTPPPGFENFRRAEPKPLMQLDGTYILARFENELYIFDQHAAAERVLYEKLAAASAEHAAPKQALLLPWVWDLTPQAAEVVKAHRDDFSRLGYDLEAFGGKSYRVKAVPGVLGDSPKVQAMLEGLADDLMTDSIPRTWDALLIRAACRGSVKANDFLKPPEMEKLLKDLQRCRMPWCCPHGRPTYLRFTGQELSPRFRRT
jgi:DNA mismatch repair protein MutL